MRKSLILAVIYLLLIPLPIANDPELPVTQWVEPSRHKENEVRMMTVEATAYCYTGNQTSSGTWPRRGTVAADPEVLPMGTRIYVPGYGAGIIEDTGGAIKGAKIDLYMERETECIQWGRRMVTVTILEDKR